MLQDLAAGSGGASSPRYLHLLERRLDLQVPILRGWLPRDADNNTARQAGREGPPIFKHSLTSRTRQIHVSKTQTTSKTYRIFRSFGRVVSAYHVPLVSKPTELVVGKFLFLYFISGLLTLSTHLCLPHARSSGPTVPVHETLRAASI